MTPAGSLPATTPTQIQPALAELASVLEDRDRPMTDRAAAYAVMHRLQLWLNRRLRGPRNGTGPRDELIGYMEREHLRRMGPLSIKATGIGVKWPCNDPANWADADVQDTMRELRGNPLFSDYVRHVPEHFEIDAGALGAGVAAGIEAARDLHRSMKAMGWRTEEARHLSIEVSE